MAKPSFFYAYKPKGFRIFKMIRNPYNLHIKFSFIFWIIAKFNNKSGLYRHIHIDFYCPATRGSLSKSISSLSLNPSLSVSNLFGSVPILFSSASPRPSLSESN